MIKRLCVSTFIGITRSFQAEPSVNLSASPHQVRVELNLAERSDIGPLANPERNPIGVGKSGNMEIHSTRFKINKLKIIMTYLDCWNLFLTNVGRILHESLQA